MTEIFISNLKVPVRIGCIPGEQEFPQMVRFDVRVAIRDSAAARSGNLLDTVCYKQLSEEIQRLAAHQQWSLLEQLADTVLGTIFEKFPAAKNVSLKISKFTVPAAEAVGIEVTEER